MQELPAGLRESCRLFAAQHSGWVVLAALRTGSALPITQDRAVHRELYTLINICATCLCVCV